MQDICMDNRYNEVIMKKKKKKKKMILSPLTY